MSVYEYWYECVIDDDENAYSIRYIQVIDIRRKDCPGMKFMVYLGQKRGYCGVFFKHEALALGNPFSEHYSTWRDSIYNGRV